MEEADVTWYISLAAAYQANRLLMGFAQGVQQVAARRNITAR